MNKYGAALLNLLRKKYTRTAGSSHPALPRETSPEKASEMIYELLTGENPCMIARFGGFELATVVNYLGVKGQNRNWRTYIQGRIQAWWWNPTLLRHMNDNAGFFPPTIEKIERFCELMLEDAKEVDILGSWQEGEYQLREQIRDAKLVHFRLLEPFWSENPWSRALAGKKVLVVHPFAELIEEQYTARRTELFRNPDILPEFELQVIAAVQSIGGVCEGFGDWFEALESMKNQIDRHDYDICLICCGAYGFPLAAHVKRQGKKAIHLGGALQLLFGIIGKRWEDPKYGVKEWQIPVGSYSNLINKAWRRPGEAFRPRNAEKVEGGCYW